MCINIGATSIQDFQGCYNSDQLKKIISSLKFSNSNPKIDVDISVLSLPLSPMLSLSSDGSAIVPLLEGLSYLELGNGTGRPWPGSVWHAMDHVAHGPSRPSAKGRARLRVCGPCPRPGTARRPGPAWPFWFFSLGLSVYALV